MELWALGEQEAAQSLGYRSVVDTLRCLILNPRHLLLSSCGAARNPLEVKKVEGIPFACSENTDPVTFFWETEKHCVRVCCR